MAKSKTLKGKYIADVPILLTPEHITESEFKRLKNFRDLMGWKNSKFEGNNCQLKSIEVHTKVVRSASLICLINTSLKATSPL